MFYYLTFILTYILIQHISVLHRNICCDSFSRGPKKELKIYHIVYTVHTNINQSGKGRSTIHRQYDQQSSSV